MENDAKKKKKTWRISETETTLVEREGLLFLAKKKTTELNHDLLHPIIILILIILTLKRILLDKYYTALNKHYHPKVDQN